jgi:hypothetical protein
MTQPQEHSMSNLNLFVRPWTVFDPSNQEHRGYYYEFLKTGTWGYCPLRFIVDNDHGDLITMIQRSLVNYYVEQEFKKNFKSLSAKLPRWNEGYVARWQKIPVDSHE